MHPIPYSAYANLANYLVALQRFDEGRQFIGEAQARKLDDELIHNILYGLAFLAADSTAMAEQQQWFAGKPEYANYGYALASDTEAYTGHLGKARELTRRAVDSAAKADSKENARYGKAMSRCNRPRYGNATEARQLAEAALKLSPASQGVKQ